MSESKTFRGPKYNLRRVECRAVGCEGAELDATLKSLNAEGWSIRQIFQKAPTTYYRVFAQRESEVGHCDVA